MELLLIAIASIVFTLVTVVIVIKVTIWMLKPFFPGLTFKGKKDDK